MKSSKRLSLYVAALLCIIEITSAHDLSRTQFTSHVSVTTPARSYAHGVGDPISVLERRARQRMHQSYVKNNKKPLQGFGVGYPRQKPLIPFQVEDVTHGNSPPIISGQYNNLIDYSIPVLPPSPYKVDSPDPESLWPTGLFLPPLSPHQFGSGLRRLDDIKNEREPVPVDPYLVEGSEAIAAVLKSRRHGLLYFHDIPHIDSLLANQEVRVRNNLKPHRIGSIRHTWPFYRN